jgi:hypothetical protein
MIIDHEIFWMSPASPGGHLACRLANDLQCVNESENQHLVAIEIFAATALHETPDRIEGVGDMAQPNTVLTPQIAAPPCERPHRENCG